ncbi:DMT family transporter [soil metagenome]
MAEPEHHPVRMAVAIAAAFGSGVLVATQSRINGELGQRLGDGFVAAVISFGSGLVILSIAMLFWKPGRAGLRATIAAVRGRRIPWWYTVGGIGGGIFVLGQGLVVGLVGVALFTVGIVAGQTVSSLLIDRRGLGTMVAKPITAPRLIGAVLALAAVGLAVSGQLRAEVPFWVLIAPIVVGLILGWQQAVNGQVRSVSGSVLTATFGNFVAGTALLVVILLAHLAFAPLPDPERFAVSPGLYLGGLVGCVFIGAQAVVVRITGLLVMSLAVLSGQLATAALFDLLLPLDGHRVMLITIVGTALTLLAVVIAAIPSRRHEKGAASSGSSRTSSH